MAVFVNNVEISPSEQDRLLREHGFRLPPGRWWYDSISGAWGCDGTPALGITCAHMTIGGPLPEDATVKKGGMFGFLTRSGIYINGRELAPTEAQFLGQVVMQAGVVLWRGRYYLDAQGNFGAEGQGPSTNLYQLIAAIQMQAAITQMFSGGGGGGQGYCRQTSAGYIGGDGQSSYFFDPQSGASVMT